MCSTCNVNSFTWNSNMQQYENPIGVGDADLQMYIVTQNKKNDFKIIARTPDKLVQYRLYACPTCQRKLI